VVEIAFHGLFVGAESVGLVVALAVAVLLGVAHLHGHLLFVELATDAKASVTAADAASVVVQLTFG